jgi:DNA topoisomerase-1
MAPVETYIPTDVKQTVEKEVKQKPSMEERTTVESPGKPVSASFLENKPKKMVGTKSSPKKIIPLKRDIILIITEKPQAAQKIAFALGNARKLGVEGVYYYELVREGEKIVVASAVGHLFGLDYKAGQKGWPIFEVEWVPSYNKKAAAFTKKYYEVLNHLAKRAKEFIIATDYDIEGEVIGWNVLRFICKQDSAKRMKFSTLTSAELEKSYRQPLKELDWGNAYAGETRHILDWLYGINLSRALMSAIKTTKSFRIMSIGRVQGPALKIIVDREREISSFKSEPFWRVSALCNGVKFNYPEDIFDKSALNKFKKLKKGSVTSETKEEFVSPPTPFDLTTLQREAYNLYKIHPSETLRIAQQLYLDGLISYPRTSSQKIPKEIEPKKIIAALKKDFPETKQATRDKPFEGKKSDPAHPSIYPTGEPASLTGISAKLYSLIVKRFLAAFSPDAKLSRKRLTLNADGLLFYANAQKILEQGWMAVYPNKTEEGSLPDMNGEYKIEEIEKEEKETQPPKRYTPASLITTLEKKNLGTKATRSSIVDTLFDRGYLEGTSIKATELGMKMISALEKYSPIIIDENLTRKMEDEIEEIRNTSNKKSKEETIVKEARQVITDISKTFKSNEENIGKELSEGVQKNIEKQKEEALLNPCPKCGKGNLRITYSKKTKRYFISCNAYPACTNTYTLPPNALMKKSDKNCESCGFPKVLAIRKGKRPWELCFNPECELVKKQRAEWEAKKVKWTEKKEEQTESKVVDN